MAQPRKFPQFPLAETLTGNELVLLWQGLGNRRITLNTLKAFFGEGGGGGGFDDVGAGLSIDGDGNPRLGAEDETNPIQYKVGELFQLFLEANEVNTQSFVFNLNESTLSKAELYFQSYFAYSEENFVEGGLRSFLSENTQIVKLNYSGRLDETPIIFDNFVEFYEKGIEVLRDSDLDNSGTYQGLLIGNTPRKNTNERIAFIDEILLRGAGDAADYSATKEDLDYVTKLMLDNYYPEGFILTTNTVSFNRDNVSGITTARTGDVLVDLTNAKVYGTFTMIHNDASAFGFFLPDGVTPFVFYQSEGTYDDTGDNILDFQFIGDGKVRLTISQPD
jgi:hypothetical protein